MPNVSFESSLLLVRSRGFFICLELGYSSFKIHILMLFMSACSLFPRRVSRGCFQKKVDCKHIHCPSFRNVSEWRCTGGGFRDFSVHQGSVFSVRWNLFNDI